MEVANFYQNAAFADMKSCRENQNLIVTDLKLQGREKEIQEELKNMKSDPIIKELAYCEGSLFDAYLHDMAIIQEYASWNRKAMAHDIGHEFDFEPAFEEYSVIETVHNYIDIDSIIIMNGVDSYIPDKGSVTMQKCHMLRKGAVSAKEEERLIIPLNMRDGSLLCVGKGNPDWNFSAPHGAGRLYSRSEAKQQITLHDFKRSMEGIFTTSVNQGTLDESPMAYKDAEMIIDLIIDTVDIKKIIRPIYNFKSSN